MRLLLDTHCWLWSEMEPERLNPQARSVLEDGGNVIYFSAASSWEVSIKFALGKLRLPAPPAEYVPRRMIALGLTALAVQHTHALRVADLPKHHRDPFDRLLVAQAQVETLELVTADPRLAAYDVKLIWAGLDRSPR